MVSICHENRCIACCVSTNMVLTNAEVELLESLGFDQNFFCYVDNGWIRLKNVDGRCVFHDGENCRVYAHRPMGCRVYPITFDSDSKSAVYDSVCPYSAAFPMKKEICAELFDLVEQLIDERDVRRS